VSAFLSSLVDRLVFVFSGEKWTLFPDDNLTHRADEACIQSTVYAGK